MARGHLSRLRLGVDGAARSGGHRGRGGRPARPTDPPRGRPAGACLRLARARCPGARPADAAPISGWWRRERLPRTARRAGTPDPRPCARGSVSRFEGDLVGRPVGRRSVGAGGPAVGHRDGGLDGDHRATAPDRCGAHATLPTAPAAGRSVGATARVGTDRSRPTRRAAPSTPSPATDAPRPERTDDPSGPARHDAPARTRGPERTTVVPVAIHRADPPPIGTPADGRATPSRRSPTAVPSEPDVVHVHIGRVEVRAIVPAPEPSRPAPRPARPAPLSLDRYLSGERRT